MEPKHVAFCLDQAYGHLKPTLGIAKELLRRGHRVSYSVSANLSAIVQSVGATAVVFEPLVYRSEVYPLALQKDGSYDLSKTNARFAERGLELRKQKTANSLAQLQRVFQDDKPDVIIHDDAWDFSGRELADLWNIPRIKLFIGALYSRHLSFFADDRLVLVAAPRLLCDGSHEFDDRFEFLGFSRDEQERAEWVNPWGSEKVLLVSPTTGLLPQIEFCRLAVAAFGNSEWKVVLSAASKHDPVSAIQRDDLGDLPDNFVWNESWRHNAILRDAALYVGQGGPTSTLESLYQGVPVLLIPPSKDHDDAARRVQELGLGLRLALTDTSPELLRSAAMRLIGDAPTLARIRETQDQLRQQNGAISGADRIEAFLSR